MNEMFWICLREGEVGIWSTFHLGVMVVLLNVNSRANTPRPYKMMFIHDVGAGLW